ncbi:MAG: hypothetical protein U1E05_22625 [Patescibacteria group bacterium]|nr:hypothetical protein [Patescibacteria group bacterium]
MRQDDHFHVRQLVSITAVLLLGTSIAANENANPAPQLAAVSGKITYADGSRIPGARIQLVFIPLAQVAEGQPKPRPSIADVNVQTGEFPHMSTFEAGDGATVGHHRIMVTVLGPDGKLSGAVPEAFSDPATTPLRIEVENRRNWIQFELPKPQP